MLARNERIECEAAAVAIVTEKREMTVGTRLGSQYDGKQD